MFLVVKYPNILYYYHIEIKPFSFWKENNISSKLYNSIEIIYLYYIDFRYLSNFIRRLNFEL